MTQWRTLFEAQAEELQDLRLQDRPEFLIDLYASTLQAYLLHDLDRLKELQTILREYKVRATDLPEYEAVETLLNARLCIRERKIEEVLLSKLIGLPAPFKAEGLFVAGLSFESKGSDERAEPAYRIAAHEFASMDCHKKSLRAKLNALACSSRTLAVDRTHLSEFRILWKTAHQIGDLRIAGILSVNISREYLKLGCLSLAIKNGENANQELRNFPLSLDYGYALAHWLLLMHLGKRSTSFALEQLEEFAHPEVAKIKNAILVRIQSNAEPPSDLHPSFSELLRLDLSAFPDDLGPREQQFIELLENGPLTRKEVQRLLYPEVSDERQLHDRLKALIKRLQSRTVPLIDLSNPRLIALRP